MEVSKIGIFDKFKKKDEKKERKTIESGEDAITQLSQASDEKKIELTMELLKHWDYKVRNAIISAVVRQEIRAIGVWFELANRLADGIGEVRMNAAKAFWELDGIDYAIRSLRDEYTTPAHMSKNAALKGINALRKTAKDESIFENLLNENWENYPGKKTDKTCPECGSSVEELKGSSVSPYINTYHCTQCEWAKPRCGNTRCDGVMTWTSTSSPSTFRYTCTQCNWSGMGPRFEF